jgi:hypothetical protein
MVPQLTPFFSLYPRFQNGHVSSTTVNDSMKCEQNDSFSPIPPKIPKKIDRLRFKEKTLAVGIEIAAVWQFPKSTFRNIHLTSFQYPSRLEGPMLAIFSIFQAFARLAKFSKP